MTAPSRDKFELPRNATGLQYQMIGTVIGFSIFYFFIVWLIRRPFKWFDAEPFLGWFAIFFIFATLLIITIVAMQRSWNKRSYYLRGNMIVVAQKNPWTGAVDENIFRLDTVISANVKQTVLGKHNNYGDIILSVPKTGDNNKIILKDIENPRETVIKINNLVDKSGSAGIAMTT